MAFCLLHAIDQNKYGLIVKSLSQQFALGNNQNPKDIMSATNALSTHRFEQKYYENQKRNNERNKLNKPKSNNNGMEPQQQEKNFNQQKGMTCYYCSKKDHSSNNCHMKDKIQWRE